MKKKLLLGLVTLGAASMLCGFDSAETADSVAQKMQEASSGVAGMTANAALNVDAALNVGDGTTNSTIALLFTCDYDMATVLDPLSMQMDMAMHMSMMGQSEDMNMKMYMVPAEDGSLDVYTYTEDSASGEAGWSYESTDSIDISEITSALEAMNLGSLSDWGIVFELALEAADFNGTECYLLSTTIDTNTLSQILNKVSELAGEDLSADEDVSMVLAMMEGLKLNHQYYVDTTTYLPVSVHLDMNDSDLTMINQYIQLMANSGEEGQTSTMELVLNDVSMDMTPVYGTIDPITVPQEAIDAVASGEAEDLGLGDTLELVEETIE